MTDYDEISYPFMEEKGMFTDYEILTDGLSSYLGLLWSIAEEKNYSNDLIKDMQWLTEQVLHMNGSLRGKLAIDDSKVDKLKNMYHNYKEKINMKGFTLPTGSYLSSQMNIARYKAKEVVRLLNKIEQADNEVPKILFRFSNILANLLYAMSLYVNKIDGVKTFEFKSESY